MRNIKLTIAYDGTEYSGWQRQQHAPTIQGEIEKALARICAGDTDLHGAGRTDAGVHALAMTANFITATRVSTADFHRGLNSILPGSIRVNDVCEAALDFHSRFSARSKTYFYNFDCTKIQSPFNRLYALQVKEKLDFTAMRICLPLITGTHDFASFEASGSRDRTVTTGRGSTRTIIKASLDKSDSNFYRLELTGDGFLRHMVRNIAGTILEVGRGKTSPEEFAGIVEEKKRAAAGATAPAHGLFLKEISY